MKSGLEGRNNQGQRVFVEIRPGVSMKSGLEGRNNVVDENEAHSGAGFVSMKSGLEGRNNPGKRVRSAYP